MIGVLGIDRWFVIAWHGDFKTLGSRRTTCYIGKVLASDGWAKLAAAFDGCTKYWVDKGMIAFGAMHWERDLVLGMGCGLLVEQLSDRTCCSTAGFVSRSYAQHFVFLGIKFWTDYVVDGAYWTIRRGFYGYTPV